MITRELINLKELTQAQVDTILANVIDVQSELTEIPNRLQDLSDRQTFAVEALLIRHPLDLEQILIDKLTIRSDTNWDLLNGTKDAINLVYYRYLRLLRVSGFNVTSILPVISLHANPNLPWCCETNADIVTSIIEKCSSIQQYMPEFISTVYKDILKELHGDQTTRKSKATGGLRPRLGFNRIRSELNNQERNDKWKLYPRALAISWFLIDCATNDSSWKDQFWLLTLAFILNVMDDSDIPIKVQMCKILNHLVSHFKQLDFKFWGVQNSGLMPEVIDGLKKCLVHIPSITPVKESRAILCEAYPCIREIQLIYGNKLDLIDILNSHILSSLNHLLNSHDFESTAPIIELLLENLDAVIDELSIELFVSMSKVMFMLNQIITNDRLLGTAPSVIIIALRCHQNILRQDFPIELSTILFTYHYDLMGSWFILVQRLRKYEMNDKSLEYQVYENFKELKKLSSKCNKLEEFNETRTYIETSIPECKVYI